MKYFSPFGVSFQLKELHWQCIWSSYNQRGGSVIWTKLKQNANGPHLTQLCIHQSAEFQRTQPSITFLLSRQVNPSLSLSLVFSLSTMFQLRLDQGAVLLKQAVTPLVEMVQFADIRISPEDLTLVSVSNNLMFPQVFIALRMRSLMFAQFRCNETRWICINLRHLFSALAPARSEDSIEIHGDEGEDVVGFLFKNPSQYKNILVH